MGPAPGHVPELGRMVSVSAVRHGLDGEGSVRRRGRYQAIRPRGPSRCAGADAKLCRFGVDVAWGGAHGAWARWGQTVVGVGQLLAGRVLGNDGANHKVG